MFSFFNELFYGGTEQHDMVAVKSRKKEPRFRPVKRIQGRKRSRVLVTASTDTGDITGNITSTSTTSNNATRANSNEDISFSLEERPLKKSRSVPAPPEGTVRASSKGGDVSHLLNMIPDDVVNHVLSYCGSTEDRFALQTTCKTFHRISNDCEEILNNVSLGGDVTGKGGIVQEEDTPETAAIKLTPFVKAGNLEAIYMLGMLKSYCDHDVDEGIHLLKTASKRGYVRATYTLGLILRDLKPREARHFMNEAAEKGYLPALQEVLPAREMKAKYGEPSAGELCQYLDPVCLNRLLGRTYVLCPHLRDLNTSHCWNPLCGRWAFRAHHGNSSNGASRTRRLFTYTNNNHNCHNNAKNNPGTPGAVSNTRVSRMKMCSRCCRAKYCSKLCQVFDWRSGRHKVECPFL